MKLTNREVECIKRMADGHSDRSAAKVLGISPRTVRFHLNNAKKKLKARTRCQLVAFAIRAKEISA